MNASLRRARRLAAVGLLCALALPAAALEYRNTVRASILYDAPSTAATRVAIAGDGLPLEVVVVAPGWVKVRDPGGRLAWIEQAALDGARRVMVQADVGLVRRQPRADAEVVFRAARGVLLELGSEAGTPGWVPVRHGNGLAGWLPLGEVWGR